MGIGASAGGLEAFRELLGALPAETGMAFAIVAHLDPSHESRLPEVLARSTRMPVHSVTNGLRIEPEHVYVIPPNATMTLRDGTFVLTSRESGVQHLPIDRFFESLAEGRGDRAVGVVLSGAGSDGTLGLKAIRAEGGITFVQNEQSAKYAGMPHSALEVADFVLEPREIALELSRIGQHPVASDVVLVPVIDETGKDSEVAAVARVLRRATGVDFTQYKPATIRRRVARRMVVKRIEDLDEYVQYLRRTPDEIQALYTDVLIQVTRFFRDREGFEALTQQVFPYLLGEHDSDEPIRVWVPACSTGEEAYSLAICLMEFLEDAKVSVPIQVFGTDVSHAAIARARSGTFSTSIEHEVSPARLRRYFTRVEHGYQISRIVRESCVFAPQDLTKDPPFSRLDLVSCSNVLIYFNTALQERTIPVFHYALKPHGFLKLGRSESVGRFNDLFTLVDRHHRIYQRKPGNPQTIQFGLTSADGTPPIPTGTAAGITAAIGWSRGAIEREADRLMLGRYSPAGVIVNAEMEIVQVRGKTGLYLEAAPGAASFNLFRMARDDLQPVLRRAVQEAEKTGNAVVVPSQRYDTDGHIAIEVVPVGPPQGASGRHYLVLFIEGHERATKQQRHATAGRGRRAGSKTPEAEALLEQLARMREEHSAVVEELSAATEEAQSSNEELQSTNEELETAKEELQATNEELTTVNDELASRHTELSHLNNDLLNLLASVQLPIIMVDTDLRVRRMTPASERILNLVSSDTGRALGDLKISSEIPELESLARNAIDALTVQEREVRARDGRWYALRVRPYRTADHVISGAVISLVDIDVLKRDMTEVQEARVDAEKATLAKDKFLAILSHELRTPLQAMLGWIRMLRTGTLADADRGRALEVIERNTLLQSRMIGDLLDVSRIVSGRLRLEPQPVAVAPVVRQALATMRPAAEAQGVELTMAIAEQAGIVLGESARLHQIVVNLLSNAIKFTPRGGRVDVRLVEREYAVELTVRDTGRGISPEDLPWVFDRFGHTDANQASPGGMGVGLAIVRHLVELHGGRVRAESAGVGHGATFVVSIPKTDQRPSEPEHAGRAREHDGRVPELRGVRVLVVEDEPDGRALLQAILADAGAEVTALGDGQSALEVLSRERFDVLVSDIMMPGVDGHALIRKVRTFDAEQNANIPALALTALASKADRDAALAAGYQQHVAKPVEPTALALAVAKLARVAMLTTEDRERQEAPGV